MGDHRASIKIEMKIHGKEYRMDSWLNYCPDDTCGVDRRVLEFFRDSWDDALIRYHEIIDRSRREEEARDMERRERDELARLKAKYEPPSETP